MSRKLKRLIIILADALLIAMSFIVSYQSLREILRYPVIRPYSVYYSGYVVTVVLYLFSGWFFKVFSRINRYVDMFTILSVGYALFTAFLIQWFVVNHFLDALEIRFRFLVLSYIFAILLISISRFVWSMLSQIISQNKNSTIKIKRTIIVGAGEAANVFFKSLEVDEIKYEIVGIVDDNKNKRGTYFHNIKVLGEINDLAEIITDRSIEHVIIAIPSLSPVRIESIVQTCNLIGVTVNRMPHPQDILVNGFEVNRLREVSVEDLLGRDIVHLDVEGLRSELQNKILLVTGAGGSIGSEICRQVIRFRPKRIILVGHGENSIYQIHRELVANYGHRTKIEPVIADIKDREKMFQLMSKCMPDTVYHAAAHKHVPLMQANPMAAVKNNIYGTKNVAEAAIAANVSKFVMVSTDKAVNSTNVMGASKRIAEMIVTAISEKGLKASEAGTKLSAVRFGNVLGSRGSVIPLFKEQIAKGGPITLTDRRMTRYFMTIPEASRLVIQSGVLSRGGEVFILDMGEPVKIYDLAKKMITLSGFTERDINIIETGIRPGEKLFEELLLTGEEVKQNIFEKIFVGQVSSIPYETVMTFVDSLTDTPDLATKLIDFANNPPQIIEN